MMSFKEFAKEKALGDLGSDEEHLHVIARKLIKDHTKTFLDFCMSMAKRDPEIEHELDLFNKSKQGIVTKSDYEPIIIAKHGADSSSDTEE